VSHKVVGFLISDQHKFNIARWSYLRFDWTLYITNSMVNLTNQLCGDFFSQEAACLALPVVSLEIYPSTHAHQTVLKIILLSTYCRMTYFWGAKILRIRYFLLKCNATKFAKTSILYSSYSVITHQVSLFTTTWLLHQWNSNPCVHYYHY